MKQYTVQLKMLAPERVYINGELDKRGFQNHLRCAFIREGKVLKNHTVYVGVGEWSETQTKVMRDAWLDGETVIMTVSITPISWTIYEGSTVTVAAINEVISWYAN